MHCKATGKVNWLEIHATDTSASGEISDKNVVVRSAGDVCRPRPANCLLPFACHKLRHRSMAYPQENSAGKQVVVGSGCVECGAADIHAGLKRAYDVSVCPPCARMLPQYAVVSRTKAKDVYLLSDRELDSLPVQSKPNPHNAKFAPVKLYLTCQLQTLAWEKYGNWDGVEKERKKRADAKAARKAAAAGQAEASNAPSAANMLGLARTDATVAATAGPATEPAAGAKRARSGRSKHVCAEYKIQERADGSLQQVCEQCGAIKPVNTDDVFVL